jgi:type II restriction enzyme
VRRLLTATDLVQAIAGLQKNISYNYIDPKNQGKIDIDEIKRPEGPIYIRRYNPSKKKSSKQGKRASISIEMLWRYANALSLGQPINIDRAFAGSYNTRSALEALLAHTPEFYYCYPGRIEVIRSRSKIKKGHKHLIWMPNVPHESGIMCEHKTENMYISEVPAIDAVYEALIVPEMLADSGKKISIDIQRRHAQMQIALIVIGSQLGSRIWVASNDRAIEYKGQKISQMNNVIPSLDDVKLIQPYEQAAGAARFIDCIWFRNARFMPAVFEIEHSTGITSGLTRMKNFKDQIPPIETRWVIVAHDEDRHKVFFEANKEQFREMNICFFPYSSVEELYSLCQRRKISGVTDSFLDSFMERTVS